MANLTDTTVFGNIDIKKDSLVKGNLEVNGTASVTDALGVAGAISGSSGLSVTGNGVFTGYVKASGGFSGNATTATKFASSQSVTLIGDVTGTASSQAGWSITTTIGDGKVTNAMLVGSIANAKLANSSIIVGDSSVSLGGTVGGSSSVISNLYASNYHVGTSSSYITYNTVTGSIDIIC